MAATTSSGSVRPGGAATSRPRRGVWRDPVFHFLVLGALLLAGNRWFAATGNADEIIVSESVVQGLRADHQRRTGVAPTKEEEEALVRRYVDDEILYREALALGLDRGDIIVRRRLLQKMTFLLEDSEPIAAPTDGELAFFLEANRDRYGIPERVSLRHVYVSSERQGEAAAAVAEQLARRLADGVAPAELGDPFLLGHEFSRRDEKELASVFGEPFAATVMTLPEGPWSAPIRSSYGLHLVQILDRQAARVPTVDEARFALDRDWHAEQRKVANRRAQELLRERYDVRIEARVESPSGS